jgi:hypothetical protein
MIHVCMWLRPSVAGGCWGRGGGHVIFNVGGWWLMFHAGDINLVWQALGDV